jgi:hypothetical protein
LASNVSTPQPIGVFTERLNGLPPLVTPANNQVGVTLALAAPGVIRDCEDFPARPFR